MCPMTRVGELANEEAGARSIHCCTSVLLWCVAARVACACPHTIHRPASVAFALEEGEELTR